jgi:hypothetical protein
LGVISNTWPEIVTCNPVKSLHTFWRMYDVSQGVRVSSRKHASSKQRFVILRNSLLQFHYHHISVNMPKVVFSHIHFV